MKLRTLIQHLESMGNPELDVFVVDYLNPNAASEIGEIKFTSVNPEKTSIPSSAILFPKRKSNGKG